MLVFCIACQTVLIKLKTIRKTDGSSRAGQMLMDRVRIVASSHKTGHDTRRLVDGNPSTFWQSEGTLPHWIHFELPSSTLIDRVVVELNRDRDESYTPSQVVVLAGPSAQELIEVSMFHMDECVMAASSGNLAVFDLASANDNVCVASNFLIDGRRVCSASVCGWWWLRIMLMARIVE